MTQSNQLKAPEFSLSFQAVAIASQFISPGDIRYYLSGMLVTPVDSGGVLVTASDGHSLAVMHDPTGSASRAFIFKPDVETRKLAQRNYLLQRGTEEEGDVSGIKSSGVRCVATVRGDEIYVQPLPRLADPFGLPSWEIDAVHSFPNWAKVIPAELLQPSSRGIRSDGDYSFNPALLRKCCDVARMVQGKTLLGTDFYQSSPEKGLLVNPMHSEASIVKDLFMVLMPMRGSTSPIKAPKWLKKAQSSGWAPHMKPPAPQGGVA